VGFGVANSIAVDLLKRHRVLLADLWWWRRRLSALFDAALWPAAPRSKLHIEMSLDGAVGGALAVLTGIGEAERCGGG
jgi:hypothetical protein